jgi:phospholipid/cholesterol/gamma-HCH transport system substrate-binding protein
MTSWLGTPEFKVGFLVVVVSGLIGVMAMKVAEGPSVFSGARKYWFRVDSASGLVQNSAVKMAGIKMGIIRDIILEEGRARIVISVDSNAKITPSTTVQLKADGILGDKHVELVPGDPNDQELASGSELKTGANKGGIDDLMAEVSRVAKSMGELMDTLNKATKQGDEDTRLGRIISNIEAITADLKDVTGENKGKINEIIERVRNLAKNVDTYINEESLARVDRSLKNIEEITGKINRGEGTLGRLVNDEQTVEELNNAITNVNKFLGGADKLQTSVDFHSEFMTDGGGNKSFLGIKLQPGLDRYYELDVISDSFGVTHEESSVSDTDGKVSHTTYKKTFKNQFKITGLFAKNFWDFTIKGGIIENFGGVGIDYHLLPNKSLTISAEFFNFNELQIRAFMRYNFFKGVYIVGGGDNLANKGDRKASAFVGAGIFITNDDLKMLAAKFAF